MMLSMAYDTQIFSSGSKQLWLQSLYSSMSSWLVAMAIGMSFGITFGALLHTVLRYYPLKPSKNVYWNTLQGALLGAPMGVCANCSVPMACGITRGNGKIETALGYLFSSPNFNPVVVTMTFLALPLRFGIVKYIIMSLVILLVVPLFVTFLEKRNSIQTYLSKSELPEIPRATDLECRESFMMVLAEVGTFYLKQVWMIAKPTLTIMLIASAIAAVLLNLVPWDYLLSQVTLWRAMIVSLIAVMMPVPIALDVMFAAQLHGQHVPNGFVMLFLMTLGTYSIIPSIYLWREVSKLLSVSLFLFFWVVGTLCALTF
jgi:uncharacterized membrane protein YraQ (UPF0718 family)